MSISGKKTPGINDLETEPSGDEPGSIEFRPNPKGSRLALGKFELSALPFEKNALEPYISSETLEYHYEKHHRGYVDKLNQLIQGTDFATMELEDIMAHASGPIFNHAAQAWNHTFFWRSLIPPRNYRQPQGDLLSAIERDFGTFDQFLGEFRKAAGDVFGSGWAWLVRRNPEGSLAIETTANAENPLRNGHSPLLTCDVWEHAYYIDYRNERAKYLDAISYVLNWEFAERNYSAPWALAA